MSDRSDLDAAKTALADWTTWLAAMDGPNPGACREVAPAFRSAVGHLRVALDHAAELEATRSPVLSPAAFDTIVTLGFTPGTENPVGWLMGEARRLRAARDEAQTTLRDLRALLDYIAHVGWDASCEAAAGDALEAEDATRLNRYAVRVAGEREDVRTAALHEAVAVLRELADNYLAAHGGGGDYCCALYDATNRIEALTTATNRSDDAR